MRFKSIEYQKPKGVSRGGVAQLGEHLPCKQGVKSSNLSISTGREAGRLEDMTGERIKSVSQDTYLENRILNENKYQDIRGRTERSVRIKLENKEAAKAERDPRGATLCTARSSRKEHRVDALALRADERRDKLRKASGRSKYPLIRRYLNGETRLSRPQSACSKSIAACGEPGELKHLSSRRKRKKHRFRE